MRVVNGLEQLAHVLDRRQQPPAQPLAHVNLELVELSDTNPAALSHEEVGMKDVCTAGESEGMRRGECNCPMAVKRLG